MRENNERLEHMLEAIEKIEKYAALGEGTFRKDELVQNWMLRHVQIIGEAARAPPQEFRDQHPSVPWNDIIGMRHVLVHDYFDIDLDIVWGVVNRDIPILKREIKKIFRKN